MDIQKKIEEIVSKIKDDPSLLKKFETNPTSTINSLLGTQFSEDQLDAVASGVKAKLGVDSVSDLFGKAKGLFGK